MPSGGWSTARTSAMYEAKQQGRDRVAALAVPHARSPLALEHQLWRGTTAGEPL